MFTIRDVSILPGIGVQVITKNEQEIPLKQRTEEPGTPLWDFCLRRAEALRRHLASGWYDHNGDFQNLTLNGRKLVRVDIRSTHSQWSFQ
jgi:hypothetical protein